MRLYPTPLFPLRGGEVGPNDVNRLTGFWSTNGSVRGVWVEQGGVLSSVQSCFGVGGLNTAFHHSQIDVENIIGGQ